MTGRYTHTQHVPNGRVVHHDYSHSTPLFVTQRVSNYRSQNCGGGLTVPQERQVRKAAKRARAGVR